MKGSNLGTGSPSLATPESSGDHGRRGWGPAGATGSEPTRLWRQEFEQLCSLTSTVIPGFFSATVNS